MNALHFLSGMHWLRPDAFLLLLVVLPLVSLFWWGGFKLRQRARIAVGEEHLISRFTKPLRMIAEAWFLAGWLTAMSLFVVAIAGPVLPDAPTNVSEGSLQIVLLTDVSRSMAAEEYRSVMPPKDGIPADAVPGPYGTRLDMAKMIITKEIMPATIGNQMGIATYMGNGWDVSDMTTDYTYVRDSMNEMMKIGNAPGGGSHPEEGLAEALRLFKATPGPGRQKVIVWFTDGGVSGDEADKETLTKYAAQIQEAGIRVILVGLGGNTPVPIPVYDDQTGQMTGSLQKDGATVTTQADEASMSDLQTKTNAEFERILPGEKTNIHWASTISGAHSEAHEVDVYEYPLGAGMAIFALLFLRGIFSALLRRKKAD